MVAARESDYRNGPPSKFALGCDLGQSIDPTALCLVERRVTTTDEIETSLGRWPGATNSRFLRDVKFILRGAELLPMGTGYAAVAEHIAARQKQAEALGKCTVIFDETGARGSGDFIRGAVKHPVAAVLTGSTEDDMKSNDRWTVSKGSMVTRLLASIEAGDLEIAADLPDGDTFIAHMTDLRRKISTLGHMSFNAMSGRHDDYVTAAGLALWWHMQPERRVETWNIQGYW